MANETHDIGSSIIVQRPITRNRAFETALLYDPDSVKITILDSADTEKVVEQVMIKKSTGRYSYTVQTEAGWIPGQYRAKIIVTDATYGNDIDIEDEFILE